MGRGHNHGLTTTTAAHNEQLLRRLQVELQIIVGSPLTYAVIAAWTLVVPRISLEIVSCGGLRRPAVIGRTPVTPLLSAQVRTESRIFTVDTVPNSL